MIDRRKFLQLGSTLSVGALSTGTMNAKPSMVVPLENDRIRTRNQNRSTLACSQGMVATSQPLAAQAGLDILKKGGNAVDAAIAANAVLSVVEPMSNGPGGDLFAIYWHQKDQKLYGLNASGRSPNNWNLKEANALGLNQINPYSPLSWSVPGCVSGWDALSSRFGALKFPDLMESAIHYADSGFPLTPIIADGWIGQEFKEHENLFRTFAPDGKRPRFGDWITNKDLAIFFKTLAKQGPKIFYQGEIAERIVRYSDQVGGRFSKADFQDHSSDWVDPVSSSYRGFDVWELPPNGQGIAALQILNLLEHFDMGSMKPNSAEHLHLFLEAKKLAFEDRAVYYADMDFAEVPLTQLISKAYAADRVKLIDRNRAAQKVAPGRLRGSSDTIYLTAADNQGNMISFIQSIYHGWGSRWVPDGLGFVLQNRGELFSLNPNDLNKLEPGKRPFHTIIPAFVTKNDQPLFSFGVMGGDFQPQGHAQVLMNMIDFGMSPQQAGEQARVAHFESSTPKGSRSTGPGSVGLEEHIAPDVKQQLSEMGHRIRPTTGAYGGYQGIWRMDEPLRYFGGSDPRKDGCAVGY
ncbi:MAG: gamma-glutamyltransferase [Verrucomicrobia bacterium]|nr:gamma-glutamyltransferase [Verrucomicrobiota bacterium]